MTKKRQSRSAQKRRFRTVSISSFFPKTLAKAPRGRQPSRKSPTTARSRALARKWRASHYVALLLMASSLALLILLFTDARFSVTQLTVSDNRYLSAEQIQQNTHLTRSNIFSIDPQQVALQMETMLPQVKEAHVRLGIPNQIAIQIIEREPVLIYGHNGKGYWVDTEGHIFPAAVTRDDLPVLIDEDGSAKDETAILSPVIRQTIHQISEAIPETTEFHYRKVYGLFFISPEGWRVYLGDAENIETKLAMWQTLHQQLLQENRAVQVVDLRYDRVYIQ